MNRFDLDFSHLRNMVLIGMRLLLAFIFIKAGLGKWPVVDGQGLTNALPLFLVYLVVIFEFFGGLFMIIGLRSEKLTKLGALMIAIVMVGAAYMHYAVWDDPFASKDVLYPISLLLISLIFVTQD
tara:strand:+ start:92 stop:466 length:375 start_codon:yes stop_codon:yes gene_type:complete